jgi:hypothetical protein
LKELLRRTGKGFWDDATLVNALLAVHEWSESEVTLRRMNLPHQKRDDFESATRFYDDILSAFQQDFNWRKAAGVTSAPAGARM